MLLRLLVSLLLGSASLLGQPPDTLAPPRRFQIGGGFGSLMHEVDVTPNVNQEPFTGSAYNVALRYFDNPIVGFQAELSYVRAGWAEILDTSGVALNERYERRTDYVELLILTQLSIGRGVVQPLLQAGPYLSFPLGSTESVPAAYEPPAGEVAYYGRELPFRVNYGAIVALGLNFELGPVTLQPQGRYLAGFSDLIRTGTTVANTSRRTGIGWHFNVFVAL